MEKQAIIAAYRRGLLTADECAQILGVNREQVFDVAGDLAKEERGELREGS
ncbi:hypothetical protein BSNK01_13510 [Bacillaceae bacterium]